MNIILYLIRSIDITGLEFWIISKNHTYTDSWRSGVHIDQSTVDVITNYV